MMKFKVGDKVRVISKTPEDVYFYGKVGFITDIRQQVKYPYVVELSMPIPIFRGRDLEKVENEQNT